MKSVPYPVPRGALGELSGTEGDVDNRSGDGQTRPRRAMAAGKTTLLNETLIRSRPWRTGLRVCGCRWRRPGRGRCFWVLGAFVAVEVTIGQWAYTYLTDARNVSDTAAAIAVAGFWGASTVGRLTMAHPAAARLIARVGVTGIAAAAAFMFLGIVLGPASVSTVFLAFVGLLLSPIVPSLFARYGKDGSAVLLDDQERARWDHARVRSVPALSPPLKLPGTSTVTPPLPTIRNPHRDRRYYRVYRVVRDDVPRGPRRRPIPASGSKTGSWSPRTPCGSSS